MKHLFKNVLAVVVGALAGMVLIVLMQNIINMIYPLPAGTDMYDTESARKAISMLPTNALVLALVNYTIASFIAGMLATLLSKRETKNPPLVVGAILMVAGLWNIFLLHEPVWFSIISLFTYMPFTYLGYLMMRKKTIS